MSPHGAILSTRTGRVTLVVWLAAFVAGCAAMRPPPTVAPPPTRTVPLGLCEDYPEETRTIAEVERDLDALAALGIRTLRVSIGWDGVEPVDDQFDFAFWDAAIARASARGVRLLPYVAYTPVWAARSPSTGREDPEHWKRPPRDPSEFGELMQTLAARYAGAIETWELWNEPDNRDYWLGSVEEFNALLAAGADGVRKGNRRARTVFGGIAGGTAFLAEAFAAGAAKSVDVVNAHAYYETWNPSSLETLPDYLDEIAGITKRLGEGEPVWLAEVGYGAHRRGRRVAPGVEARFAYEHTEPFQAVALVRIVGMALAHPVPTLVAWYELKDLAPSAAVIGDENNRHLGVLRVDRTEKPAALALRFVARLFGGGYRTPAPEELRAQASGDGQARTFVLADGRAVVIAWVPARGAAWQAASNAAGDAVDRRVTSVAVTFARPPGSAGTVHDELGRAVAQVAAGRVPGGATELRFEVAAGQVGVAIWPAR